MVEGLAIDEGRIRLYVGVVPWDSRAMGCQVAAISDFSLGATHYPDSWIRRLDDWLIENEIGIVSCRLGADKLNEIHALESAGFRFIEVVLHPYLELQAWRPAHVSERGIRVMQADSTHLQAIDEIAGSAFAHDRFHMDPHVSDDKADARYRNWIHESWASGGQVLYSVLDEAESVVGFFLTAAIGGNVDWLLTAIDPKRQGLGVGRNAWATMLQLHQQQGFESVSTTISASNTRVLDLYSNLGFRFHPPKVSLHRHLHS